MVFNKEKLFYCFKNIWQKSGKLSGHIFSIYKSFNIWSWSKYWTKPPKTISAHFKDLKYFYRKYFHKIQEKSSKSQMHIVITLQSLMSIKVILVHQNAPKHSLTRNKFEQVCTTNFFSLTPTFVSMFTWPNEATKPSGASRRSDMLN